MLTGLIGHTHSFDADKCPCFKPSTALSRDDLRSDVLVDVAVYDPPPPIRPDPLRVKPAPPLGCLPPSRFPLVHVGSVQVQDRSYGVLGPVH